MAIKNKVKALLKGVPKTITYQGKRYYHYGGAAYSKSFRDFICKELKKEGFITHVTFTKPRGYQIYIRDDKN